MDKTERLADKTAPTQVNKDTQRRRWHEEDLQRLQRGLCRYVLRIGATALVILLVFNTVLVLVLKDSVFDVQVKLAAQQERGVATDVRVDDFKKGLVGIDKFDALNERVKTTEGSVLAIEGTLGKLREDVKNVNSTVGVISANVAGLTYRTSEEEKLRNRMIDAMEMLSKRLEEQRQ